MRATQSGQNQTASAATASSSGLVLPQATRVGPAEEMRTHRDPEKTSSCTPPQYTHDHPIPVQQQGPCAIPLPSLERSRSITAVFASSIGQIELFLLTRLRSVVDYSLEAGDTQRHWHQACLPDGQRLQCPRSLPRTTYTSLNRSTSRAPCPKSVALNSSTVHGGSASLN